MKTQTKETLNEMTADKALELLKDGNKRFVQKQNAKRDLMEQVEQMGPAQFPFAVVLGCIDSRVPPELIFDLGIGDVFSIRIAGNFVNPDILGSMEFACKVIGSKHILVLGHTSCGAIQGAYDDVKLGNLTGLLENLKPAVLDVQKSSGRENDISIDEIAEANVRLTIEQILEQSPILKEMADLKEIKISGAMYDVKSGVVSFL